jgi:hypothetical protein
MLNNPLPLWERVARTQSEPGEGASRKPLTQSSGIESSVMPSPTRGEGALTGLMRGNDD